MQTYFQITNKKPASDLIKETMKLFNTDSGRMLELGCGSGSDTLFVAEKGWCVDAIDASAEAIKFTQENTKDRNNVCVFLSKFEELVLEQSCYNLIYSYFAISFCQKEQWDNLWQVLHKSLKIDGIISIVLFGVNDDFATSAKNSHGTYFTKETALELFNDEYEILKFVEREVDATSAVGQLKHWHTFEIIARKRP